MAKKKALLNRTEYVALQEFLVKSVTPEKFFLKDYTGRSINRLVMLNLLTATPNPHANRNGASCEYDISDEGRSYLQSNEKPPISCGETLAGIIYSMLGDAEYECAPPFRGSDKMVWYKFVYDGGVEKIPAVPDPVNDPHGTRTIQGYKLTPDGRAAFESTDIGLGYTKRMEIIRRRDEYEERFLKTKQAEKLRDDQVGFMLAKAAYYRKHGLEEFAHRIEVEADVLNKELDFKAVIGDALMPQDKIEWSENLNAYRKVSLRDRNKHVDLTCSVYDSSKEPSIWQIDFASTVSGRYHPDISAKDFAQRALETVHSQVSEAKSCISLLQRAQVALQRLNAHFFPRIFSEVNNAE